MLLSKRRNIFFIIQKWVAFFVWMEISHATMTLKGPILKMNSRKFHLTKMADYGRIGCGIQINIIKVYSFVYTLFIFSNLINKRHGSRTLEQTIWLWNHTSHTKVYFNEFVANVFRDKGPSINYVVSKSVIFDPLLPS